MTFPGPLPAGMTIYTEDAESDGGAVDARERPRPAPGQDVLMIIDNRYTDANVVRRVLMIEDNAVVDSSGAKVLLEAIG